MEQSGEDIFEIVQAVMCDLLSKTRCIAELLDSKPNRLVLQGLGLFVHLLAEVMEIGAHGRVSGFALLFKTFYEPLVW